MILCVKLAVIEFFKLVEELREVEVVITDELTVFILLSNLSKKFENFVVTMEIAFLKIKLLEEGKKQCAIEESAIKVLMEDRSYANSNEQRVDKNSAGATNGSRNNNNKCNKNLK